MHLSQIREEAQKEEEEAQETGNPAQERHRETPWEEGEGTAKDETVLRT